MKIKTGTKNSKIGTPRIERVAKPKLEKKEKTPRAPKQEADTIPTWVRESSEKKSQRAEGAESKLQWRKETKKSQRSFSKNKAQEYTKSKQESASSDARGGFLGTFDKAATYEGYGRRSSWDPKSKKPGTGFEKSKTGYKGVGSAWDKSTAPRVSTRTWDDVSVKEPKKYTPLLKPTWEKETKVVDKKKLVDPTK